MNTSQESKLSLLFDRSKMLNEARAFFLKRGLLEVDCPSLLSKPSLDPHIDCMETIPLEKGTYYLHTSPEFLMKRLLAMGAFDLFQIGHVFRKGEIGRYHSPEFALVEWYRKEVDFSLFLEEALEFCSLFLGDYPFEIFSYSELFLLHLGFDPLLISLEELKKIVKKEGLTLQSEDKDLYLQLLLTELIEPKIKKKIFTVVKDFPRSQAALAKSTETAERFEIYFDGIELGNGYHELTDPKELKERFLTFNALRKSLGKKNYPLDETLLKILPNIGDCYGIAIGFDRLMMLRRNASSLAEVLPVAFEDC